MQRKRVVAASELPFVLGSGEAPDIRRRDFPAPQISAVKVRLGSYSSSGIAIARLSGDALRARSNRNLRPRLRNVEISEPTTSDCNAGRVPSSFLISAFQDNLG
jgi:hypothetical protein